MQILLKQTDFLFSERYAELSKDDRQVNKDKKKIEFKTKKCEECGSAYKAYNAACPYCFHKNKAQQKAVKRSDGKLVPIDEITKMQSRFLFYTRLKLEKGWKDNAPYLKLYEEFGDIVYLYPQLNVPKWVGKIIKKQKLEESKTFL